MRTICLLAMLAVLAACRRGPGPPGGSGEGVDPAADAAPAAPARDPGEGMVRRDLSAFGIPATALLPAEAKIEARGKAGARILAGPGFDMEIREGEADLGKVRARAAGDAVRRFLRAHVEAPDLLMYEVTMMGQAELHFAGNVRVRNHGFTCRDLGSRALDKAAVVRMVWSCQSLEPPEPPEPEN